MNMVVSHWSASPLVLAGCAVVAVVHLRGIYGRPAGRAAAANVTQAAVFYLGVLAVIVALVSPVGYWSRHYIWIRSLQDMLLAVAAPGLIVLGAPWLTLARGLGRAPGPARAEAARAAGPPERIWRTSPVAVTAAFSVIWWGWHVPALYDAALRHPEVYAAEVLCYLGAGIALWLQLIGSGSAEPRFSPLQRVGLAVGTLGSMSVLALGLIFGSWRLYPAYAGPEHRVFSVVADQQVGGAVIWVLALLPSFAVAVALLLRWLNEEGSQALTTGLDRMLKPRTSAWPSRPGLR